MGFALQLKPANALGPTDSSSSVCGSSLFRARPSVPDPLRTFSASEEVCKVFATSDSMIRDTVLMQTFQILIPKPMNLLRSR